MAITWRNIGQSGNSGNSLIKSGGDTIAQGLNTLRGVAQDVSDEGTRKYNTQSDINTAGVLADINRFSQEDIDTFDINSITEQFGTQYDATGIADALDARVGALQEVAQQEADNTDRSLRTQNALATGELNRTNLQGQIATRAEAKAKADKFSKFSREANKKIGKYISKDDLIRDITQSGQAQNQSGAEIRQAINTAVGAWDDNIELKAPQKNALAQREQQQTQNLKSVLQNQYDALDAQASELGIIPELVDLATTPDTKETTPKALAEFYDSSVNREWFGESSVKEFETELATRFNAKGLPNPNGAELKRFLTLGFDAGTFLGSNGLHIGAIEKDINKYIKMRTNKEGIKAYKNAKSAIQEGSKEHALKLANALTMYGDRYRANNRSDFNEDIQLVDEPIPPQLQDFRPKSLKTQDWFKGISFIDDEEPTFTKKQQSRYQRK